MGTAPRLPGSRDRAVRDAQGGAVVGVGRAGAGRDSGMGRDDPRKFPVLPFHVWRRPRPLDDAAETALGAGQGPEPGERGK